MDELASKLNATLSGTVAERLLSNLGRRMFFPRGIVAQAAEASARADRYNATVGMAFQDRSPMILPSVARYFREIPPEETVAYAPTPGVPALRDAWRDLMIRKNPRLTAASTSRPMVVPGLTNGVFQTAELFVEAGDTVVLPDMYWGNYRLILQERRGATILPFPYFTKEGGFNIPGFEAAVRKAVGSRGVRVLLNFPNNPTGYTPTLEEVERIVTILRQVADDGTPVLVICDDAYFGLVYETGVFEHSIFEPLSNLHENLLAVKVDGATKEDFAWGFRIGFVTFGAKGLTQDHYEALSSKLMGSIRSTVSNSSRVAQSVLLRALSSPTYEEEKRQRFLLLRERYREVKRILETEAGGSPLQPLPFNSGYFMSFVTGGPSTEAIRGRLLERGIGTVAIQDRFLRIAYASIDKKDLPDLYRQITLAAREVK
jgi:aspartate/methionine/tyrosine aminotransferase